MRFEVLGTARRLPPEHELALFRIAQEALRNVERHSAATRAAVVIAFESRGALRLRVEDDGCGFDSSWSAGDLLARGSLGLNGMYERADLSGARLALRTARGRGTSIDVMLPQGSAPEAALARGTDGPSAGPLAGDRLAAAPGGLRAGPSV